MAISDANANILGMSSIVASYTLLNAEGKVIMSDYLVNPSFNKPARFDFDVINSINNPAISAFTLENLSGVSKIKINVALDKSGMSTIVGTIIY